MFPHRESWDCRPLCPPFLVGERLRERGRMKEHLPSPRPSPSGRGGFVGKRDYVEAFVRTPQLLPDADVIVLDMKQSIRETGVYFHPMPSGPAESAEAQDEFMNLHREGPIVQIFYRAEGVDPLGAATYARGFAHFFISALLLGIILAAVAPALSSYGARAGVAILIIVLAAFLLEFSRPIWFHHGWPFYVMTFGYDCGNAVLMGLVGAAVIKRGGSS